MGIITRPDPAKVAPTAAHILAVIKGDPEYQRLRDNCARYDQDWNCYAGTAAIAKWDISSDAAPLIEEALRALALKAAVYRITADERVAELPIARPVDEVLHAVLAQRQVTERMADRGGFEFVHATDTEVASPGYEPGDYTNLCYAAAFGAEPPARYWLGTLEHERRLQILEDRLSEIGIKDLGHRHNLQFI